MSERQATSDAFAEVMQQLSAEANKLVPPPAAKLPKSTPGSGIPDAIETRFQNLERTLLAKLDDLAEVMGRTRRDDLEKLFKQVDEQLAVIRNTESVNQRLFDSLHDELVKYRDNFVHESLQKPFIHDLIHLFDDLNGVASQLGAGAKDEKITPIIQWRHNLENAIHALMEVLHRLEVKEIEHADMVDRALHRVVSYEPADFPEDDGRIVMRLKRGFLWRGNVIRPEEVIAKRYA